MIATSLHNPSLDHLSSLQCFHFSDTAIGQLTHSPSPALATPTTRILCTINFHTTEAHAKTMDTPCTTNTPHNRTHTVTDAGDSTTNSLIISMATVTVLFTHCTAKAITRVHMEELVRCTQKWWQLPVMTIVAARIDAES